MKKYDVVIIGAGTAGLSARREVAKKTDRYLVIDDGPLGTTCARVGCMPSKVLIQVANDFHRRHQFHNIGIDGGENLKIDSKGVMEHVRSLRDRFVRGVTGSMEEWTQTHLVRKRARFLDPHTLDLGDEKIQADRIILAVGSRPVVPQDWTEYSDVLVNTDQIFELKELPQKMAVIGLGVIGLELGQALQRLGVEVLAFTLGRGLGGLSDPAIQDEVIQAMQQEFQIGFQGARPIGRNAQGRFEIEADGEIHEVDQVLMAVGRQSNLDRVGLENLNLDLNSKGIPAIDRNTMKVQGAEHIFIPGDSNGDRPILHEAADEGIIAGHNAVHPEQCFKRRVSLGITFSDPNIAVIGKHYDHLKKMQIPFVTGEVSFKGQGRSIVKLKEKGKLRVYVDSAHGKILGAELFAPEGEHLAHLLAWAISLEITVFEALKLPFYHPVIEEGLRTALRDAASRLKENKSLELFRCQDSPIR